MIKTFGNTNLKKNKIFGFEKTKNRNLKISKSEIFEIWNFRNLKFSKSEISKSENFEIWNLKISKFFDPTFFWRRIFPIGQKINDRLVMEIRSFLEPFPVRATEGDVFWNIGFITGYDPEPRTQTTNSPLSKDLDFLLESAHRGMRALRCCV